MSQTANPVDPVLDGAVTMSDSKMNASVMPTTTSHATPQTPQSHIRTPTISSTFTGARLSSNHRVTTSSTAAETMKRMQQSGGSGVMYSTASSGYTTKHHSSPSWYGSGVYSGPNTHYSSTSGASQYGVHSQHYYSGAGVSSSVGSRFNTSTRAEEGHTRILSERIIEHEVKVPKRVVVEELVEKVVVIPEKIVHEELIEEAMKIRERIIEIARPIYQEKIVEVPEYEYIERIVEVPELIIQEKIKEVPRIEIQERLVEIPKIIIQEKIVEVPEIEYREVPFEKIVEVPEIREEIVYRQVPVPQYFDKPIPEYVNVEVEQDFPRSVPVPVEVITTVNFTLPKIRSKYLKVDLPIYVPRFVEVALPIDLADAAMLQHAESYSAHLQAIANSSASLCDVENLAYTLKATDWNAMLNRTSENHNMFQQLWESGKLAVDTASFSKMTIGISQQVIEKDHVEAVSVEIREHDVEGGASSSELEIGEVHEPVEVLVDEQLAEIGEVLPNENSGDDVLVSDKTSVKVKIESLVNSNHPIEAESRDDTEPLTSSDKAANFEDNSREELRSIVDSEPQSPGCDNLAVSGEGNRQVKQKKKKSSKKDGEHVRRKRNPKHDTSNDQSTPVAEVLESK